MSLNLNNVKEQRLQRCGGAVSLQGKQYQGRAGMVSTASKKACGLHWKRQWRVAGHEASGIDGESL